jgi:hypothetical protein
MLRTAAFLTALSLAAVVIADDINPPSWRSQPNTTYQHWDFHAGPIGGAPDGLPAWYNQYGTPNFTPSNPSNWLSTLGGRNDVWAVNDFDRLDLTVPNANDALAYTDVWIQVTYQSFNGSIGTAVTDNLGNNPGVWAGFPTFISLPGGWVHKTEMYRFFGAPPYNVVTIFPPTLGTVVFVDQVVVDTITVPAPATLGPMAALGLAAVRRRRR